MLYCKLMAEIVALMFHPLIKSIFWCCFLHWTICLRRHRQHVLSQRSIDSLNKLAISDPLEWVCVSVGRKHSWQLWLWAHYTTDSINREYTLSAGYHTTFNTAAHGRQPPKRRCRRHLLLIRRQPAIFSCRCTIAFAVEPEKSLSKWSKAK